MNRRRMIELFHASPDMPLSGDWREGTYFADSAQKAQYYSESHHRGNISVQKVKLPQDILFREPSTGNYRLMDVYSIKKSIYNQRGGKTK